MNKENIPYNCQWIDEEDITAVIETLKAPFLTQGPKNKEFENALSSYLNIQYAANTSSGTSSLHTCVAAAKLEPGFKAIVPAITFAATANCMRYQDGEVLFADVHPNSGLIDINSLESQIQKIRNQTDQKGIIATVSINGQVSDLPAVQSLASKHNFYTIEDAAHSLGATYEHERTTYKSASCSHSDMAILSFHPLKHICTAEGGAALTNDKVLAERMRRFVTHAIERPFALSDSLEEPAWKTEQVDLGYNYRMTDIQAALGVSQLKRLPKFLDLLKIKAQQYITELSKDPFSKVFSIAPHSMGHANHLFVIHFKDALTRNRAFYFLKERKIFTQVHYTPVYAHPYYKKRYNQKPLAGAEKYSQGCLSIPLFPQISEADQARVIEALFLFCEQG